MTDLRSLDESAIRALCPPGGFQIVLADPPWRFQSNSDDRPGRNPRRHYQTMRLEEIEAIPVKEMCAKDALLLMWVTVPFAELSLRVVNAWGFRYKSQLVWPKGRIGTGYYARNEHELVSICRRGKFALNRAIFPTSIIPGARREHSRKPDWVHEQIEAKFPEASKVELFARAPRPGWVALGNDTERFST
ncbi:MAG: hypothetical protein LCH61_01120 [Proteobacteria bacterium]|nr:hypothetical protein [Pseudomonadota bacterium]